METLGKTGTAGRNSNAEIINLLMLLVSFALACILPFDVFLFSYAVLGPLHYLTELQWLNSKNFFLQKPQALTFVALSAVLTLLLFAGYLNLVLFRTDIFSGAVLSVFFIFCTYLVVMSRSAWVRSVFILLAVIIASLYFVRPDLIILLGLFIPTLIHVYIFTALFMVSGYYRSPDIYSLVAIVLLLSVPFLIYFLPVESLVSAGRSSEKIFNATGFRLINSQLVFLFKGNVNDAVTVLKVQVFIAFAYTYHYLNWFAKTSVIGWARALGPKKIILVSAIWILSIALYLYNYQTGLTVLFVLSMLHVLAEFPLNALSVRTVFQKMISKNDKT